MIEVIVYVTGRLTVTLICYKELQNVSPAFTWSILTVVLH